MSQHAGSPVSSVESTPLRARVVSALKWRVGSQALAQIFYWSSTLIVVRLLHPSDYGLMAMTQSMTALLMILSGDGINVALIQKRDLTAQEIRKAYGLLIVVNVGLCLAQIAAAPIVAAYYRQEVLTTLLRVQAVIFLTVPFIGMPAAICKRRLDFKGPAIANVGSGVCGAIVTLVSAWFDMGVWALISGQIALFSIRAAIMMRVGRVGEWPSFDFRGIGRLASFGGVVMLSTFLWYIYSQADILIAGRSLTPTDVGIYATSLLIAQMAATKILPALNDVGSSVFAFIQSERDKVAKGFLTEISIVSALTMPFFAGLAIVAPSFVPIVLGEQWIGAVAVLQLLALAMPLYTLSHLFAPVTNALGHPEIGMRSNLLAVAVMLPAFWFGASEYGLLGLTYAWLAAFPIVAAYGAYHSCRVIGLRLQDIMTSMIPGVVCSIGMAELVWEVERMLGGFSNLARMAIGVVVGVVAYPMLFRLLFPTEFSAIVERGQGSRKVTARAKGEGPTQTPAQLTVVVDVEEDFDWSKPFASGNTKVESIASLHLAHTILRDYGISPAYVLTHPVAESDSGRRVMDQILASGKCELGAQLHPWVTPPHREEVNARNSYPCNLPPQLEREKISALVDAIRTSFGGPPEIYKAGRYGLDLGRAATLCQLGFKVDTSVMPFANFSSRGGGPDFFGLPDEPFWLVRNPGLLAIPATQSVIGPLARRLPPSALRRAFSDASHAVHVPSLLSRLGLLERIRLSPEVSSFEEMKALVDFRLAAGARHLCLSFHSPTLAPGNTPYVRNEAERDQFLMRLRQILDYIVKQRGVAPRTALEVHADHARRLGDSEGAVAAASPDQSAPVRSFGQAGRKARKILLVSGFTPPRSPMGAVRTGHLMQWWRGQGDDVRAVAIDTESPEGPVSSVDGRYYIPKPHPSRILSTASRILKFGSARTHGNGVIGGAAEVLVHGSQLRRVFREAVHFPDRYRGWIDPAVSLALSWRQDWIPDVIYSSGPPHSSHIAAARLAAKLERPWVAELRDLWASNPYDERHPLIEPFFDALAKSTLSKANACVAVTNLSVARAQALTGREVVLSYNGFDPAEFAGTGDFSPLDADRLTILHAGVIYPGRRDPSPLFAAIRDLGDDARRVNCIFFHDPGHSIAKMAASFGVEKSVQFIDRLPRAEIIQLERRADLLLECHWTSAQADGVIAGKLFEYIGARRPVLSLGSTTGETADIVNRLSLGLASNDSGEIANLLRRLLKAKLPTGRVPDLAAGADLEFSRARQFAVIDRLFDKIASQS